MAQVDRLLDAGVIDLAFQKDAHFEMKTDAFKPQHPRNILVTGLASMVHVALNKPNASSAVTHKIEFINLLAQQPDSEIQALENDYESRMDFLLDIPLGTSDQTLDLTRSAVRTKENAFGNFIADALREYTDAEIGLVNGGTIRSDRVYMKNSVISHRDIVNILPYRNSVVLINVSGKNILATLEHSLSAIENANGRFIHVSGMRVRYDSHAPAGERLLSVSVNGEPLDPNKTYAVATLNYVANGGDGYSMLKDSPTKPYARPKNQLLTDVISDTIQSTQTISPQIDGRLMDVAGKQ